MPVKFRQKELFREAVWVLDSIPRSTNDLSLILSSLGTAFFCVILLIKFLHALDHLVIAAGYALLLFSVLLGGVRLLWWLLRLNLEDRKNSERFNSILPLPRSDDVFPVFYTISYEGGLTGFDLAAATFVEGWLSLDGARASFALHAGEGRSHWQQGKLTVEFPDGQRLSLWTNDAEAQEHFRHAANLWIADRERPEGESILPPLVPHSAVCAGWGTLTVASQLISVVSCVLVHWWVPGGPWRILLLAFAFVGTPMFVYGLFVIRKQDDAMRRTEALTAASRIPLEPL